MSDSDKKKRLIISSQHLVTDDNWPILEVELALSVIYNAFQKWIVRCASASGVQDMNPLDVLVLHNINHREKRRVDIGFMLNIEDTHTVNYAIKKLVKLDLVEGHKRGKEIFYNTTDLGIKLCEEYKIIREQCLISSLKTLDIEGEDLSKLAATLRTLSGMYDQAARAAAAL